MAYRIYVYIINNQVVFDEASKEKTFNKNYVHDIEWKLKLAQGQCYKFTDLTGLKEHNPPFSQQVVNDKTITIKNNNTKDGTGNNYPYQIIVEPCVQAPDENESVESVILISGGGFIRNEPP